MTSEQFTCQITNIFFQDENSGYLAFRAKKDGSKEEVTLSGTLKGAHLAPGDQLTVRGIWFNHKTYGKQFNIKEWKILETDRELNRFKIFLASGAIRGIGPHMAERIIKKFGKQTLEIFQNDIDQLKKVEGIGPKVHQHIVASWNEVKNHHFLYGLGISGKQVKKILERYGSSAEEVIKENPYLLAEHIEGIGFAKADQIAQNLGVEPTSPFRIKAGLIHVLKESHQSGHCYLPEKTLVYGTQELTGVPKELVTRNLDRAKINQELVQFGELVGSRSIINTERAVADKLQKLSGAANIIDEGTINSDCLELAPFELDPLQVDAIKTCLTNKVSIITGFPGSGKSLCTKTIVGILNKNQINFKLLAPTGRASKRLAEVTGFPASTIHRYICQQKVNRGEFAGIESGVYEDEASGRDFDSSEYTVFIVDESSMIDIFLLRMLIDEIDHHVVFIGDIDQLPPVGPGNTLKDLIDSERFPVIRLTKIFRQEAGSAILKAAFEVNKGQAPELPDFRKGKNECSILPLTDPDKITDALSKIVLDVLPKHYPEYDIKTQVQVISPYNKGRLGTVYLNEILQNLLNPQEDGAQCVEVGPYKFYQGDKVIQTVNDYDKNVFNGDMGIVTKVYPQYDELTVEFPHTTIRYTAADVQDLALAWGISVHKVQGSEIPVVIMIAHSSHYNLLQRNLLYTGITRAQKLLILISSHEVLEIAAKNDKIQKRHTLLKERIRGEVNDPVVYF